MSVRLPFWISLLNPKNWEQIKNPQYRSSRIDVVTLSFTPTGDHQTTFNLSKLPEWYKSYITASSNGNIYKLHHIITISVVPLDAAGHQNLKKKGGGKKKIQQVMYSALLKPPNFLIHMASANFLTTVAQVIVIS